MYNIRSGAIQWQKHGILSDVNSNVYSISHRLRDSRETMQKTFTLKLKVNVKEEKNGTCAMELEMFRFS